MPQAVEQLDAALIIAAGHVHRLQLQPLLTGIIGNGAAKPQQLVIRVRHDGHHVRLIAGRLPSMRQRWISLPLGKQIHLTQRQGRGLFPRKHQAERLALRREGHISLGIIGIRHAGDHRPAAVRALRLHGKGQHVAAHHQAQRGHGRSAGANLQHMLHGFAQLHARRIVVISQAIQTAFFGLIDFAFARQIIRQRGRAQQHNQQDHQIQPAFFHGFVASGM